MVAAAKSAGTASQSETGSRSSSVSTLSPEPRRERSNMRGTHCASARPAPPSLNMVKSSATIRNSRYSGSNNSEKAGGMNWRCD
jgi:hypothetical protein